MKNTTNNELQIARVSFEWKGILVFYRFTNSLPKLVGIAKVPQGGWVGRALLNKIEQRKYQIWVDDDWAILKEKLEKIKCEIVT